MDFESAVEYLKGFISYEDLEKIDYSDFNLDRIRDFAKDYGVDYSKLKYVHVGGSKGKGSTCGIVAEYLRKCDQKVGLFTSPYIIDITECFWVDGDKISREMFVEEVESLKKFIDEEGDGGLTYFEFLTILVLKYFLDCGVEIGVLEVGLGGRLDATNIVVPKVVGLTRIEMEHADVLGDTIEKIVGEKLGIVKDGISVVVGEQSEEVFGILKRKLGKDAIFVKGGNDKTAYYLLKNLLGEVDDELFVQVVGDFKMIGRGDVRHINGETVVFDMAHTPGSMDYLIKMLKRDFSGKKFVFLVSVMKDKKAKEILQMISDLADKVYLTSSHDTRGYLGSELREFCGGEVIEDSLEAFSKAIGGLKKDQILIATGSHFLISKILPTMQ